MKRLTYIALLALVAVSSCKKSSSDDDSDTPKYTDNTSTVLISSFALKPNAKVLASLDSVYFAIDTERMMIYNADSLPVGTNVSRLQVSLSFGSSVSGAVFFSPSGKEIPYGATMTDSIDFSQGPVRLNVVSYDGKYTGEYKVMVNVHKMQPDSIMWSSSPIAGLDMPSGASLTSTLSNDGYVVLANDGTTMRLARTESLVSPSWQTKDVTFPAAAARDLTWVDGTLYCLAVDAADAVDGALVSSADGGDTWVDTGARWRTILGAYDGRLLGVALGSSLGEGYDAATNYHVDYPSTDDVADAVPAGFPVMGASDMVTMSSTWSLTPYVVIAGGVLADGKCTGNTWSYDGERWGLFTTSTKSLPALRDVNVIPYYIYSVNTVTYAAKRHDALYAFGGFDADGNYNKRLYVSTDNGINWAFAATALQLPSSLVERQVVGDAYVESTIMHRNAAPQWRGAAPSSAVTSWDCPHMYVLGTSTGGVPEVLGGVYARLMFVPIY